MRIWSFDAAVLLSISELFVVIQDRMKPTSEAVLTLWHHDTIVSLGFQSPLSTFLSALKKHAMLPNTNNFWGGWTTFWGGSVTTSISVNLTEVSAITNKRLDILLLSIMRDKSAFYLQSHRMYYGPIMNKLHKEGEISLSLWTLSDALIIRQSLLWNATSIGVG